MPLRIYRADLLQHTHERKQMDRFLKLLISKFERDLSEVHIIIDVDCGSQLDALIFKDQVFIAIELKNVSAHLILPGGNHEQWAVVERGRSKPLPSWGLNQLKHHREAFAALLWDRVLERKRLPWMREDRTYNAMMAPDDLRARVCSWVVVNSEAEVEIQNIVMRAVPWFDALPMDQAARSLQAVGERPDIVSKAQFEKLLEVLGAQEVTYEDWLARRAAATGTQPTSPKVHRIDFYLDSGNADKIIRALGLVAELRLDAYATEAAALTAHADASVRRWALDALISLRGTLAGASVGEALHDVDATNRDYALGHLTRGSYPEALPSIDSALPTATGENLPKMVKALTNIGGPAACKVLFTEAMAAQGRTPLEDPVPMLPFVKGLGEMKCVQARDLVHDLLNRGLAGRHKWSPYVRENAVHACIEALGQIGVRRDRNRLESMLGNDFLGTGSTIGIDWTVIRALGDMGDPASASAIIPFLDGHDASLRDQAIWALARTRSKKAFGALLGLFQQKLRTDDLWWQLSEALIQIDPEEFERHLRAEIKSRPASAKENRKLIQALWKIATPASTETLFSLLSAPETCESAGSLLGERLATQAVRSRARGLLSSPNECERIGAIWLLQCHWRTDLFERLGPFERDPSEEVRCNVAQVYSVVKSVEAGRRLIEMLNDPSERVRSHAFTGLLLAEEGAFVGEWAVSFNAGPWEVSRVIAGRHGVVISAEGKVKVIAPGAAALIEFATVGDDASLVKLHGGTNLTLEDHWTFVHREAGESPLHAGRTFDLFSRFGRVLDLDPQRRAVTPDLKSKQRPVILHAREAWKAHEAREIERQTQSDEPEARG